MRENRTVVIISHSNSQIINLNVIFVLKQRRVVESGTHEELYKNGKTYCEIFNNSVRSLNLNKILKTLEYEMVEYRKEPHQFNAALLFPVLSLGLW